VCKNCKKLQKNAKKCENMRKHAKTFKKSAKKCAKNALFCTSFSATKTQRHKENSVTDTRLSGHKFTQISGFLLTAENAEDTELDSKFVVLF